MNRYNYDNKIGMYADDNGEWCRVNGWISVDDRLPNYTESVLIYHTSNYGEKYISVGQIVRVTRHIGKDSSIDNVWYMANSKSSRLNVTHWQPLPAAPNK